jgi:hypothetical protein
VNNGVARKGGSFFKPTVLNPPHDFNTMSIKTRIEAYTGTLATVATESILNSIAKVIELIPDHLLTPFVAPLVTGSGGVDITNKKVLGGECSGYPAKEVMKSESAKYADANSIFFASSRCPIYYLSGGKAYTLPTAGAVEVIDYSAVAEGDASITCLPNQFEEAVVIDVAIAKLEEKLASVSSAGITAITLPLDSTYEAVTLPADLLSTDFLWTNATASTLAANVVATLTTGPTMVTATTDLSGAPTIPTAISSFTDPFAAALNSSNSAPQMFLLNAATSTGSGSSDARVISLVYPPAIGSLTTAWTNVVSPSSTLASSVMDVINDANIAISALNTAVTTDLGSGTEDIELSMAHLSQIKALTDAYLQRADSTMKTILASTEIEKINNIQALQQTVEASHNELAKYSQNIQLFQAYAQALIAEHKENVDLYQAVTSFELAQFRANLERTQASQQSDLAKMKANLELWQSNKSILLQNLQLAIQANQNDVNAKIQVWNADVQTKIKNADIALQAAAETAKMSNDIAVQNAAQAFQAKGAKYSAQLQGAAAHMQKRQSDIQLALQKQAALISQAVEQYKAITTTIQVLEQRFIGFFAPFQKPQGAQQ